MKHFLFPGLILFLAFQALAQPKSQTQPLKKQKVKKPLGHTAQSSKTATKNTKTALDVAIMSRDHDRARLLIEQGVPFEKNKNALAYMALGLGDEKLYAALKKRNGIPSKLSFAELAFPTETFAVKAILAAGGNPNEVDKSWNNWPILHEAARASEVESVRALLDAGANIEAKADYWNDEDAQEGLTGITPAFMSGEITSAEGDDIKTLDLLLKRGANPNAVDTHNGFSLLMWRAIWGRSEVQAIDLLLKAGAKIDLTDHQGQTALHLAARNNLGKSLQRLLKANHTHDFLEARDDKGCTALLWAVAPSTWREDESKDDTGRLEDSVPAIAALVDAGADIHAADNTGATVFHRLATSSSRLVDVKATYLWKKGFKTIDVKDKQGATPLFIACQQGNISLAEHFLSWGADPDASTNENDSPRKFVARPVHSPRPETKNAKEKKAVDAWYQVMDEATTTRNKEILAIMNKKQAPK